MPTFKSLNYRDKLHVGRSVTRGEAPRDPRMATAAVELAESYLRQGRAWTVLMGWHPVIFIAISGLGIAANAADGDQLLVIAHASYIPLIFITLMFNPATRPKNRTRSLEASRRVIASSS